MTIATRTNTNPAHRFAPGTLVTIVDPHPGQDGEWVVVEQQIAPGPHHIGPQALAVWVGKNAPHLALMAAHEYPRGASYPHEHYLAAVQAQHAGFAAAHRADPVSCYMLRSSVGTVRVEEHLVEEVQRAKVNLDPSIGQPLPWLFGKAV